MSSQLRKRYDIIINGGGIVGFTMLNLILKSPHLSRSKVLLIEQAKKPTTFNQSSRPSEKPTDSRIHRNEAFSNRVSSITQTSKIAFEGLSIWDSLKRYAKDVRTIKVWNYSYSDKLVFKQVQSFDKLPEHERDVMFSVIENNRLSLALLDNIHKIEAGKDVITWNHSLKHFGESEEEGTINIILENNETGEEISVNAPLILGCDGLKSKVRDLARMRYTECDLNKSAVVGTVKMSSQVEGQTDENDIAYQRFSAENDTVAALLPLDKEYSSFVISAPNEYAKQLMEQDDGKFISIFNQLMASNESSSNTVMRGLHNILNTAHDSLHEILQSFSLSQPFIANEMDPQSTGPPRLDSVIESSRATFPLLFGTTTPRMIAPLPGKRHPQIALLGDSSHRIHPLAGQGLNLGIQDAIELVRQLEKLAKCGENLFNSRDLSILSKALRRYEIKRQAYIVPMSAGILSMPHLFNLLPSRMLTSINKCDPIKSTSVKIANGC